eukprot:TRINITY_DN73161_c0_g1_i1.p1 TRINITY_DN73161_c0_g1~~TRINITY_DN73161_c0_g1_i1.p1  ORF type:complete len:419 (+),score=81.95 TRINITY_DN73161_c0_g1_i1:90-1346(+)
MPKRLRSCYEAQPDCLRSGVTRCDVNADAAEQRVSGSACGDSSKSASGRSCPPQQMPVLRRRLSGSEATPCPAMLLAASLWRLRCDGFLCDVALTVEGSRGRPLQETDRSHPPVLAHRCVLASSASPLIRGTLLPCYGNADDALELLQLQLHGIRRPEALESVVARLYSSAQAKRLEASSERDLQLLQRAFQLRSADAQGASRGSDANAVCAQTLVASLNALRSGEVLCDAFIVTARGERRAAHQVVLAAACPELRRLLLTQRHEPSAASGSEKCDDGPPSEGLVEIEVRGEGLEAPPERRLRPWLQAAGYQRVEVVFDSVAQVTSLDILLEFLYGGGDAAVPCGVAGVQPAAIEEVLADLLRLSVALGLVRLFAAVSKLLRQGVTADNAARRLAVAMELGCTPLAETLQEQVACTRW